MRLEELHGHTIDVDRLRGGWVLDVGCRDFHFARAMVERGCKVIALDADPTIEDPEIDGITFRNLALDVECGARQFVMHENPEARHILGAGESTSWPKVEVETITLMELTELSGYSWDCVKLDVEGAEYRILKMWPGAISRQISIEFHEHCIGRQPDGVYGQIFGHLAPWYEVAKHERDSRHCIAEKFFWDSLLVDI